MSCGEVWFFFVLSSVRLVVEYLRCFVIVMMLFGCAFECSMGL